MIFGEIQNTRPNWKNSTTNLAENEEIYRLHWMIEKHLGGQDPKWKRSGTN